MKRILALALAALVTLPPTSFAQQGGQPVQIVGQMPNGNLKRVQVDADGKLLAPIPGFAATTVVSAAIAASTTSPLAGFTAYQAVRPSPDLLVRIATTGFAANAPWRVKFLVSYDNATWSYLMNRNNSTTGAGATWADVNMFVETDTLMYRGHGNNTVTLASGVTSGGFVLPLAVRGGSGKLPPYIGAVFSSDSSAGASGTAVVEIGSWTQP